MSGIVLHCSSARLAEAIGASRIPAAIFNDERFHRFACSGKFLIINVPNTQPLVWEIDEDARRSK